MIFPRHARHRGGSIAGALIMLVAGFLFLAGTMLPGWSIDEVFRRGWPFLVIAVGFATLIGNIVKAPYRGRLDIAGPMVLITVGALFAVQTFMHVGFNRTWPVLLIVIAITIFFRRLLALPFAAFRRRI
jgi:hypothetical protein